MLNGIRTANAVAEHRRCRAAGRGRRGGRWSRPGAPSPPDRRGRCAWGDARRAARPPPSGCTRARTRAARARRSAPRSAAAAPRRSASASRPARPWEPSPGVVGFSRPGVPVGVVPPTPRRTSSKFATALCNGRRNRVARNLGGEKKKRVDRGLPLEEPVHHLEAALLAHHLYP